MKEVQVDNLTIQRYSPSISEGLSDTQVAERIRQGKVNTVKTKYSKSCRTKS